MVKFGYHVGQAPQPSPQVPRFSCSHFHNREKSCHLVGNLSWEDIYGHRIGAANMHKDPIHVGSVEPMLGVTTLTMADDVNHTR